MIVDASAVLAVVLTEPDRDTFSSVMVNSTTPLNMSPVNYMEVMTKVLRTRNNVMLEKADQFLAAVGITIVTVTAEQALLAREAYRRFGKGNHPAKLNIGDCFAYALSRARGEPLLFKGDDFRQTDVEAVL